MNSLYPDQQITSVKERVLELAARYNVAAAWGCDELALHAIELVNIVDALQEELRKKKVCCLEK